MVYDKIDNLETFSLRREPFELFKKYYKHWVRLFFKSLIVLVIFIMGSCSSELLDNDMIKVVKVLETPKACDTIWDNGLYCAFTSIIEYHGCYYIAFREGLTHAHDGDMGSIRILLSKDGYTWEESNIIESKGVDLRDPYLSITPDDRLMLLAGGRQLNDGRFITPSYVSVMDKQGKFSEPHRISIKDNAKTLEYWLWRITWYKGVGYGICYGEGKAFLVKTKDGYNYTTVCEIEGLYEPTEGVIKFDSIGRMIVLARTGRNAHFGYAQSPYKELEWQDSGYGLGGPDFLLIDDNTYICAGRRAIGKNFYTSIFVVKNYKMEEKVCFSSYGDCGYPSLMTKEGQLWMSFYSRTKEDKYESSIYLYRCDISDVTNGSFQWEGH